MTAPRITRTGTLRAHGRDVEVFGPGGFALGIEAVADETEDARAMHEQRVRVTIEPADATPEEAPHGSSLDYLAELKGTLSALVSCHAEAQDDARDRVLRRALQLANTASNAVLAERRAAR